MCIGSRTNEPARYLVSFSQQERKEKMGNLEAKLKKLLKGEFCSLTIGFNELTASNYMSVGDGVKDFPEQFGDWVSDVEKDKAIKTNSHWNIQWYPDTPIGSYYISGSSLEAILNAALEENP